MTSPSGTLVAKARTRSHHRLLSSLLSGPLRVVVPGGLVLLRYLSTSGQDVTLPAQAVPFEDGFIVLAGEAERKTWWRAFRRPRSASLLTGGRWLPVVGRLVPSDAPCGDGAVAAYTEAHPHVRLRGGRVVQFSVLDEHPVGAPDRLLRRWVRWTVAGEMTGFVAPAVFGVISAGWSSRLALPTMVAAGAVEGLMLGAAQAHALAPSLPGLRTGRFAVGTSVAAALAYVIGMMPSALGSRLGEAPRAVVVLCGIVGGVVLLGSIGTAQWLELRRHVGRASTWIATTAAAWLAGLAVFLLIAMPLWHPGQRPALVVAIALVAAGAMATTVAVITGRALQRLLLHRPDEPVPVPAAR